MDETQPSPYQLPQPDPWGHYDRIVRMWHMQDTLLQYLRAIFLAAESILFAVAVFIGFVGTSEILFYLSFLYGILLSWSWRHVCRRQGMREGYFQWQVLKLEDGKLPEAPTKIITKFREWLSQSGWKQLEKENDPYWKTLTEPRFSLRRVRWVIDTGIPYGFFGLWIVLVIFHLWIKKP